MVAVAGEQAEVALPVQGSCARCGAASLCDWTCRRERVVLARNPVGARPGQTVVISRDRRAGMGSALLTFGLPALLMIAGVTAGSLLGDDRLAAVLAGAGLLIGGLILYILDRCRRFSLPVIVRVISESTPGGEDEDSSDRINADERVDHGSGPESAAV